MLGIKTFPEKENDFIQELNNCLSRLADSRKPKVGAVEDGRIKPKIVWKIDCLCQGFIYRTVELAEGASVCWNKNNQLSALILARGILETLAAAHDFFQKVKLATTKKDLAEIDSLAMTYTFISTNSSTNEKLQAVGSLMSFIVRFDIHYLRDRKTKHLRKLYGILSEITHPNHAGTVGFFGKLNPELHEHYFNATPKNNEYAISNFIAGYISILILESVIEKIESLTPNIHQLVPIKNL